MADFFTHFSCLLDAGTPDNAARALDLYQAFTEGAAREDGLPISIISCARSTSFAAAISSASARRGPATAICCCGSRTPRARRASRGGAP